MGSMGRMVPLQYKRLEMFTLNTSVADKIEDLTQYVAADDNNKNLNEECLVEKFASVEDLREACRTCSGPVPTRPRSYRVEVGRQAYNCEEGVYYCTSTQMIMDDNNPRKSDKRCPDDDFIVSNDDFEDFIVSDRIEVGKQTYDREEGVNYCSSTQMITDETNSRNSNKRSPDEDFIVADDDYEDFVVSDDDYVEEGSFYKKRQKKVERKTTGPRKPVLVFNLPSELPQNLQDYINVLNLEAPPLFVAQKVLTVTDVTSHQSRLLLPKSLINADFFDNFLTRVEKEMLERMEAVEVNLVDDKLREFNDLRLKKWKMNSSLEYALRKGWNNVAAKNNLQPLKVLKDNKKLTIVLMKDDNQWKTDVVVLVWCFRRESELWLAFRTQAMTEITILGVIIDEDGSKRYIIE